MSRRLQRVVSHCGSRHDVYSVLSTAVYHDVYSIVANLFVLRCVDEQTGRMYEHTDRRARRRSVSCIYIIHSVAGVAGV